MRGWRLLFLLALALGTLSPTAARAHGLPTCHSAEKLGHLFVFETLEPHLGELLGAPLECERLNPDNGDVLRVTTRGLVIYRRSTNTPMFTTGWEHWALRGDTVLYWTGTSVDPPESAVVWRPDSAEPLLPAHRIVAYYGNPLAPAMGVLGEPPVEQMLARLEAQAAAYALADPSRPVQPALELVAIVAQGSSGADGMYRLRMSDELLEEVARWAEERNYLLILDVQPGRASVVEEARALLPYLRRPYVHLALDPEFTMAPWEVPGQHIGTIDASEVNQTIRMLAELVEQEGLPPKLLIVHRFLEDMLTNYQDIQLDPHVQVVIDMDGFGGSYAKTTKYRWLVADQWVQFAGLKLFYGYDVPLLSPEQVLELDPAPDVVIYQ